MAPPRQHALGVSAPAPLAAIGRAHAPVCGRTIRRIGPSIVLALVLTLIASWVWSGRALAAASSRHPRPASPHRATHPSQVTLTPTVTGGVPLTMAPVGLSLEYSVMAQDLGASPCPPPALVAELQRLGSPPLSLGGISQDLTAPSGAVASPPDSWEAATALELPAGFWSQLHCLLEATKDPLAVGLNARAGQLAWAQQMVAGAQSAATNGLEFSLGNEPDLYDLPNYPSLAKPLADEEAAEANLYLQVAGYLQQALAGAPLVGPELARAAHWQRELPRVIAALHDRTVGVHLYPLTTCVNPREVTIHGLLSERAADAPRSLSWVVAAAGAQQAQAIISEANSASCGGKTGVSDSPAAAVWAVRFVLSALKTGFHEVRLHFAGDPYDPFLVRGGEVVDRPIESALVALNQWLPVGSSLQTILGVRELVATRVGGGTHPTVLILDNERTRARPVVLHTAQPIAVQTLNSSSAGLQTRQLSPAHGRVKLTVAANSVMAVSAAA
jgi:hypothetical protein